jgi:C-terminal processing protease CtpA/Prc
MIILHLLLVEAAGVEPDISVENTQLTDSGNTSFAGNAMISKSAVQTLYKLFQEFPERQSPDFPSW